LREREIRIYGFKHRGKRSTPPKTKIFEISLKKVKRKFAKFEIGELRKL
jgi:citrate synthase